MDGTGEEEVPLAVDHERAPVVGDDAALLREGPLCRRPSREEERERRGGRKHGRGLDDIHVSRDELRGRGSREEGGNGREGGGQDGGSDASEGSGEEVAALKGTGSRGVALERTRGNGGDASGGGRPRGTGWGGGIAAQACERRPVRGNSAGVRSWRGLGFGTMAQLTQDWTGP